MSSDARAIYQSTLDTMTKAIIEQDQNVWERHIRLPHMMSTCDGKLVHETREEIAIGFNDYIGALRRLNVTRMDRRCDTARMIKGDLVVGFHTTKMFASDGTAYPPYPVKWVMHQEDGVWQIARSDSAMSGEHWNGNPHSRLTQFEVVGGDDTKPSRILVQNIMDRIDTVYLTGDFDGWRGSVCLPLVFETRSKTGTITTEDELRKDFELYQDEFRIHQVSELTRVVKSVEQIEDDLMLGTYRVHVLSGSRYVVPPWDGAMTLKRVDGRWRVSKLMGALGHLNWNSNMGAHLTS